jgi:hypothetical protein
LIHLWNAWRQATLRLAIKDSYLLLYMGSLWAVSALRAQEMLPFPLDNLLVGVLGLIFCRVFIRHSLSVPELECNIGKLQTEIALNEARG